MSDLHARDLDLERLRLRAAARVERLERDLVDARLVVAAFEIAIGDTAITIHKRRSQPKIVCVDCGDEKIAGEFYRLRKGSDERQSRCKPCDNRKRAGKRAPGTGRVHCPLCAGLSHRVEGGVGAACHGCGLKFAKESAP